MSHPEQGRHIDPSRLIYGRLAMTNSVRRARQNTHISKSGRGKGRMRDGSESSQATQPHFGIPIPLSIRGLFA